MRKMLLLFSPLANLKVPFSVVNKIQAYRPLFLLWGQEETFTCKNIFDMIPGMLTYNINGHRFIFDIGEEGKNLPSLKVCLRCKAQSMGVGGFNFTLNISELLYYH